MDIIVTALQSIWDMFNEMSPYLLLGFLIAGLMHAFIPGHVFARFLSGNSFRSVANAALFGIPLPLCSCGVIPTAMSLRREGASKGAAVSFLIATPQTGVDSILATYSLLGLPFAIIRPIAALFTALFGGQMVNCLAPSPSPVESGKPEGETSGMGTASEARTLTLSQKIKEALEYAYVEMMEDIGKWLVMGIVIAGLISLIPNEYFAVFKDNTFASILLVMVLAIPMYLCATGSIPIAVALMLKGLTPGAALVMLMAGPASNIASILVIGKVLGRRTLLTYLASIVGGSVLFALLIDFVLPASWFVPQMIGDACCHEEPSWFAVACSILLICLLANALLFHHHDHCHCGCEDDHCDCGHDHHDHGHHDHCECGCCDDDDDDCEVLTLHIKGMHCSHCAASAKRAIESVEGVEEADVDLASGMARVEGAMDRQKVIEAIESLGFEA